MHARIPCAIALGLLISGSAAAHDEPGGAEPRSFTRGLSGALFTMSNEAAGNRVFAFPRRADGTLDEPVAYPTGGKGTDDSLGSQGALALSDNRRILLVVNAGSNELTSFAVRGSSLEQRDKVASGGVRPISVAVRGGLVYVLNAGGAGNVSGFFLLPSGSLEPIPGSSQPLTGSGANAAQVELHPDMATLVVTEKGTNTIDIFDLDRWGRAQPLQRTASAGRTPFGFEFTDRGDLIVSEAATASVSSYSFDRRGDIRLVSGVVPVTQAAPCWVTVSADDRFAFVANAGSASISSYTIGRGGRIQLANPRAGEVGTGSTPLDLTVDRSGDHLYVLDRGNTRVAGFDVEKNGDLEMIDVAGTLPRFSTGLTGY
jgi:6-phosphogluconolactonase (cycloisomerase 2 family)